MKPTLTSAEFGLFRILSGTWLFIILADLCVHLSSTPLATSSEHVTDESWLSRVVVIGALILCLPLITGFKRRFTSAILSLFLFALIVGMEFSMWTSGTLGLFPSLILLVLMLCPSGERLALDPSKVQWNMPPRLRWTIFFILMTGYSGRGLIQLAGLTGWGDGTTDLGWAGVTYPGMESLLNNLPEALSVAWTWTWMGIEILALPLLLFTATRKWIWTALFSLQMLAMCFSFEVFSMSIILIHLLVFNRNWLPPASAGVGSHIIFFDGVCGLCNRAVDFILHEDMQRRYQFAPTQGENAAKLDREEVSSGKSMALLENEILYTRSDAVLRIAAGLGGYWRVISWLRVLPRFLRDFLYEGVQRNRYRVFGKRESCRLPRPEETERFLP